MFVSQIFDEASEILATTDQTKIFRKLTQAVQTLMESGHWLRTTQEVDVCTGWDGQTITLPRGIEVPLGVNIDGSPTYFRGRLFQYNVNAGGMYNPVSWAWDDRGFVATQMDIRQPSQLVAISEHQADAGLQLRVIGTDANNRDLRSQLDDGTGLDGILVPIHAQSDFPFGTIQPDGVTIQTRSVAISALQKLLSATAHQLASGQSAVLSVGSGSVNVPVGLINGNTYYIGVDDANTITLYQTSLDAKAGVNPISLTSIVGAPSVTLTDSRNASLLTSVNLVNGQPAISIASPNEVTFSNIGGNSLPSPLAANTTYFAQSLDTSNLQVYASLNDAQNSTNPVLLSGSNSQFNVDIRKPIGAQTTLTFSPFHNYNTGDAVQAFTNGGTLPTPLIAAQNYFVHSINSTSLTLHANASDATAGTNPITFTDNGSGTNSLVKLVSATSNTGTINQITAAGLNVSAPSAPTSAASAVAIVTGSVVGVQITAAGSKYTSTPKVTFDSPLKTYTITGNTHGTTTIDGIPNITYVSIGQTITGSGIPAGTIVTAINGSTSITISNAATATATGVTLTLAPTIPVGSTQTYSTATGYAVMIPDAVGSATYQVGSIVITSSGQGYTLPPVVTIDAPTTSNGFTYASTIGSPILASVTGISGQAAGQPVFGAGIPNGSTIVSVTTSPNTITISQNATATLAAGQNGSSLVSSTTTQAGAISTLQTSFVSNIIVPTGSGGLGYAAPPIVQITGGGGTGATATSQISNTGVVTGINVISQGTGYTSAPTISLLPSTGVLVQFSSTGTLPSPLIAGTAYRLENPINAGAGVYTILNQDYSTINITGTFTGNFYVNLSKSFAIGFNGLWNGDFGGLSTGQVVYLSSDYLLPTGVNNTTAYTITIVTPTTAQLSAGSPLTLVTPTALGVGQSYFAVRVTGQGTPYNNQIVLSNIQYLSNGESVQLASTGTLPTPIKSGTTYPAPYTITLVGNNISLTDVNNNPVNITNLGVGQISMNIVRSFSPSASTSIVANNQIYDTGDQIAVRAAIGDTLPAGITAGNYYARAIDNSTFELYDTQYNAQHIDFTNGRFSFSSTGNSVTSTFYVDAILPPTLVKSVMHIEKPITAGYVSLYALDYGRSNDMTLIGQYHPSETNPKYRRIRIGQSCSWARIIYRVAHPEITSVYDYIPIENARAIIAAVHAVDLEDKDFLDQSQKYWATALSYLKNQQESFEGHAFTPPQINNITYGDGTDPVIESVYYW